ncbi:MAG: tetratricopeptide repeat protein [Acidobacteriota bacterium]
MLSIGAYYPGLRGGFVWDDWTLIVENDSVRSWSTLRENLTSDFFYFGQSPLLSQKRGYYRPLITLSYMADYALWKLDPRGFHFTNMVLHAAASASLLLVLIRLLSGQPWIAVLAAALFSVHPIHTESVSWISGRTDVMAGLFFFAALYSYLRAHPPDRCGAQKAPGLWTGCAVLSFVMAVLSKETAIVLPAVLATYEYCLGPFDLERGWRASLRRLSPYAIVGIAYLIVRFIVLGVRAPTNEWVAAQGTWAISVTSLKAIGIYASKLAVPWPLCAYYQAPITRDLLQVGVLIPLVVLVGLGIFFWQRGRGRGLLPLSFLYFLLTLLPVSNIVPIGAPKDMGFLIAERFLYVPSAAFCVLAAWALSRAAGVLPRGPWAPHLAGAAFAVPVLAAYLVLTIARSSVWHDEITFYTETLRHAPDAGLLHYVLGIAYWEAGEKVRGKAEMEEALRCNPAASWAHNNLGNMLFEDGNVAGAVQQWGAAVRTDPSNCQAWFNLARALDRWGLSSQAAVAYRSFLKSAPTSLGVYIAMAKSRLRALGQDTR